MKVDITFRDLSAEEAAAILTAGKSGGASLALFLASPGQHVKEAAPAAVAAATGTAPPQQQAELPMAKPAAAPPPAQATGPAPLPPQPAGDLEQWSRFSTTKQIVKALVEGGMKDRAAILAKCQELRAAGVAPLKAVPEDQFADRVGSAAMTLLDG